MIDLQKEAQEYAKSIHANYVLKTFREYSKNDFIPGANSKFVRAEKLQAQIDVLEELASADSSTSASFRIIMSDLKEQLKQTI